MAEESLSIKRKIHDAVAEIAQRKGVMRISENQPLISSGIVDSLGVFLLVAALEDTFPVRIADEEIIPDNFQSVKEIEQFIISKIRKKE